MTLAYCSVCCKAVCSWSFNTCCWNYWLVHAVMLCICKSCVETFEANLLRDACDIHRLYVWYSTEILQPFLVTAVSAVKNHLTLWCFLLLLSRKWEWFVSWRNAISEYTFKWLYASVVHRDSRKKWWTDTNSCSLTSKVLSQETTRRNPLIPFWTTSRRRSR